jgi:putative hydrolase of the HAD superfamily
MHESKAVIFDLDDTLYSRRRFVHSGFRAVADHLERSRGINRREALAILGHAARDGSRRELQACVTHFGLPPSVVPELVQVIREHTPALRLPLSSRLVLEALRGRWRLGIVTNGPADQQARKVDALRLEPLVDSVVYADELGSGRGKPDREPFLEAARQLSVAVHRAVFVGDDSLCDMFGAARVGMKTIHVTRHLRSYVPASDADASVTTLADVPAIAGCLAAHIGWSFHVA